MKEVNVKKVVVNDFWRHKCPKCGKTGEFEAEGATYYGKKAEVSEGYYCPDCKIYFEVISEMNYKYHIIDVENTEGRDNCA